MIRRLSVVLFFALLALLVSSAPALSAAPTVRIVVGPPPASNSRTATFTFESTDGGVSFDCALDAGAFEPCTSPAVYDNLADGSHQFNVKESDAAAESGDATSYTWTINTVAPSTKLTSTPPAVSPTGFAQFDFRRNESNSSFACALDGSP